MATGVLEIVDIPDSVADEDEDEISVLYATPVSAVKKGTTKFDAISVEDYHSTPQHVVIDLSQDRHSSSYSVVVVDDDDDDDDEVKLLLSLPKTRKRFFKGESSNSKPKSPKVKTIPLTFMCEICADEKPISDSFRVLGCTHAYCTECIGKYVASKLQENITNISCPVSGCSGFLEPQHCRFILPKHVLERWGDALCEAVILGSERFYCPFKDCSALLIDDSRGRNEFIVQSECPDCNRLFCVQCKVPWHAGLSCANFQRLDKDERSNEDIMLMKLAKSNRWKRCPKCKFFVSRSEGCLFMRCRCGYTFCYNCGAPTTDHYCDNCKH